MPKSLVQLDAESFQSRLVKSEEDSNRQKFTLKAHEDDFEVLHKEIENLKSKHTQEFLCTSMDKVKQMDAKVADLENLLQVLVNAKRESRLQEINIEYPISIRKQEQRLQGIDQDNRNSVGRRLPFSMFGAGPFALDLPSPADVITEA